MPLFSTLARAPRALAFLAVTALGPVSTAVAHPGHLDAVDGHAHWGALLLTLTAVAALAGLALTARRRIARRRAKNRRS